MDKPDVQLSDLGAFVPFPTILLDEQMPKLKDTEWRLLCVVVRQTLGWQTAKGRKRRDWMTQRQLIGRTGRNSAALSAALDALVRKNLVECLDSKGEPLTTPQQRRNHRGRVYFALAARLLEKEVVSISQRVTSVDNTPTMRVYAGWTKVGAIFQKQYAPEQNTDTLE